MLNSYAISSSATHTKPFDYSHQETIQTLLRNIQRLTMSHPPFSVQITKMGHMEHMKNIKSVGDKHILLAIIPAHHKGSFRYE